MNSNEIKRLNNRCVLNDHALVEIYQRFETELLRFFEYIKKNHAGFWANFMKLISDKSLYDFSVSFPMIERD